jgi:hypothetical protein
VALNFPVASDFPGGVIPDGEKYEDFYWDAATGAWKRECNPDKVGDCLDTDNGETVCDRLEKLDNQIIELEEEIDAIATSVGRGTWEWDFNVNSYLDARLGRGKFYMVRESDLAVVTEYKECGRVIFHEDDLEDDNHVFDDSMVDKVLMLFDRPDDDFLESVITAVQTTTGTQGKAYIIHVDRRQSEGSPTNGADAEGRYKARLNIFDQPTGGNAGEYVLKQGDDMTGRLRMERDRESVTFDPPSDLGTAHIRFRNTKADNSTSSVALFQPGPSSVLVSTNEFMSKGDFTTHEYIKACWYYTHSSGDTRRTNKQPQIYFHGSQTASSNADQYGALQFGTGERLRWINAGGYLTYGTPSSTNRNGKLSWNSSRVIIHKPVSDSSNHEGFQIRGTINSDGYASTTTASKLQYDKNLLSVYHNNGSNDAINYLGKINANSNNIVTSKWVKDNYGGTFVKRGGTQSVTIQYSNGNFLISQA